MIGCWSARFLLSDEFRGELEAIKQAGLGVEAILNMAIFGIRDKLPPLAEAFEYNAVAWLGTGIHLVRYEELVGHLDTLDSNVADAWFAGLFEACGIVRPDDWRERVRIGADRRRSGTARENLTGPTMVIPEDLPNLQKQLVDYAAPGLRALLGYS